MWPFPRKPVTCIVCGGAQIAVMGMCLSCARMYITSPPSAYKAIPALMPEAEPLVAVDAEIIAWRAWALTEDDWLRPVLQSPQYPVVWDGPVLRADVVPSRETMHGLYARKDRSALADYLKYPVIGSVALSGIVVEGATGYRAEVVTIRSLIVREGALTGRYCVLEACGYLAERYEVEPILGQWEEPLLSLYSYYGGSTTASLQQQYDALLAQAAQDQAMQSTFGYQQQFFGNAFGKI